jgi:predicted flap endonuclease-1-like 5' DNA nuclease
MSVPQKEKDRPATMLRAMFAGFGSLLSVMDKVRGKSAAEAPAAAETPAPAPAAAQATVEAEAVAEPATVAETVAPEETAAAETVTAQEPAASAEAAATETVAELPLANYDELTVASLRARLRNLSIASLTQLIEYEKGHAARADVITMFERRIAKIEAEA